MGTFTRITIEMFKAQYQTVHDRIFTGRSVQDGPFRDPNWGRLLVPYKLRFYDGVYEAVAKAAQSLGDAEAIITVVETLPPYEDSAVISWDRENIDKAHCSIFGAFNTHLFGMSGTWGILCDYEDFSCVGGCERFMRRFLEEAGGMEILKRRFLAFAEELWGGSGPEYDEWVEQLLRSVGWEARERKSE